MKKRILFTIPNFNTAGSGKAMLNIALGLDSTKFEAHIACQTNKGDFFKEVEKSGIPVHVFNYLPKSRPVLKMMQEAWSVSRKFKKINPVLIHSFHYSDNYTEALAAKLAGIKWVFTKKNMSWGGKSGNGWKLRSTLAQGIAVQNTDMHKQFYPNSSKTNLIPRGVGVKNFRAQEPKLQIRESMATALEKRLIICVANMVPVKGIELLIQAYIELAKTHKEWDLWLVGDINNEYGKKLIDLVAERKLEGKVHFSGKQSNVRDYLDHAEIFVLPTKDEGRREGSPVALLEAMANAKVVVGSAVPGVKDQLEKFKDHQFEPGDWQDLANKLNHFMLNSAKENHSIGQLFHEHAGNHYSIGLEIERHERFYLRVING